MSLDIKIEKTSTPKEKPSSQDLGFGNVFTDHMFVMDYTEGKGWHDPRIIPYGPFLIDPAAMVFHYGQEMFEGMKAYRTDDGEVQLFRPMMNLKRINRTNDRICIPEINEEDVLQAIKTLVDVERDWIPDAPGTSLYIRPFIIAMDPFLGVRPAETYRMMVILSPVGAYYKAGINPVKIYVEEEYVRAVKGGVGFAKTGGNYAASLKAQKKAKDMGYAQVLWLDGVDRKYVEEVGTMNVFFKINGEVITPSLEGSILPGVTRNSTLELLKSWGVPVTERKITIDEVFEAAKEGSLEEAFGTGTAAVISPIGVLGWREDQVVINNEEIGELSKRIYDTVTGIQTGKVEDAFDWMVKV